MNFPEYDPSEGIWLMPSRARAANFPRLFAAMEDVGTESSFLVIVGEDDPQISAYSRLTWPRNWHPAIVPGDPPLADKINEAIFARPYAKWFGCTDDSSFPRTLNWDKKMLRSLPGWGRISAFNGHAHSPYGSHIIDGNLARELGWVTYPKCPHTNGDRALYEVAEGCGGALYAPDICVYHEHPLWGDVKPDNTYERQATFLTQDSLGWQEWLQEKSATIARCQQKMREYERSQETE